MPAALTTHLAVIAGSSVMLIAGVLTGVISARWLGPESRGEYAAAFAWAAFLGVVTSMGVPQGLVVDSGSLNRLVRPLIVHVAVAFVVSSGVGLCLALTFQPWLTPIGVLGVGLIAAGSVAASIAMGLAQRLGRMRVFFQVARVVPPAAALVTMITLVLLDSRSPNVWLMATGLGLFVAGSTILVLGLPNGGFEQHGWVYDRGFRSTIFGAFGVAAVSQAVYRLDSLVLALVATSHDVAYYAVGVAALSASFALVQTSGLVAFSRLRGHPTSLTWTEARRACLQALLPAAAISAVLVWLMPWLIELLYGKEFLPAARLAQVLMLATIPMAIDFVLTHVMLLLSKAAVVTKLRTLQLLVGAPGVWLLAEHAGLPSIAALMGLLFLASALILALLVHKALDPRATATDQTPPGAAGAAGAAGA